MLPLLERKWTWMMWLETHCSNLAGTQEHLDRVPAHPMEVGGNANNSADWPFNRGIPTAHGALPQHLSLLYTTPLASWRKWIACTRDRCAASRRGAVREAAWNRTGSTSPDHQASLPAPEPRPHAGTSGAQHKASLPASNRAAASGAQGTRPPPGGVQAGAMTPCCSRLLPS